MLVSRGGVKYRRHRACTCPPVYSCVYLELVHTLPATWLGSIQGPWVYTVKGAAHGTAAGLPRDCQYWVRDSPTEFYNDDDDDDDVERNRTSPYAVRPDVEHQVNH